MKCLRLSFFDKRRKFFYTFHYIPLPHHLTQTRRDWAGFAHFWSDSNSAASGADMVPSSHQPVRVG